MLKINVKSENQILLEDIKYGLNQTTGLSCKYNITIDGDEIRINKSNFSDDTLTIHPVASNVIVIK